MEKEKTVEKIKKNKKSLSGKIMWWVAIPVVVIFILSGILLLQVVRVTIRKLSEAELTATSQAASYQVSEFFTGYLTRVEEAASNELYERIMQEVKTGGSLGESDLYDEVMKSMGRSAATDDNIMASWIADSDASSLAMSDGFLSEKGWDVTKRPWYAAAETKKTVITEPYTDVSTGKQVVTIATPVFDDGQEIIGIAGVDIAMTQLAEIMQSYNSDATIRYMLTDAAGMIIFHPNEELIGQMVTDIGLSDNLVNNILNNVTEFTRFTYNDIKNCGYVSMVGETNWNITSVKAEEDFNNALYTVALIVISIFVVELVVILIVLRFVSATIVRPLRALTRTAEEIAAGNLEVEVVNTTEDEIGSLAQAIGNTVMRLKDYIKYIDEIGAVLDLIADGNLKFRLECDYAGEFAKLKTGLLNIQAKLSQMLTRINETAGQVSEGAYQIAQTAATIADSSTEQAASVDKFSLSIDEVVKLIDKNSENAHSAKEGAKEASLSLAGGNQKVEMLTKTIEDINAVSQKINGIMESINDIAEQTNMLSLNASIEAARAGEAGRGFAVVAGEIGRLATQTTHSASETGELTETILVSIEQGNHMAQETTQVMQDVLENAEQATGMISKISEAVAYEKQSIEHLKGEIEQIMSMVENNTAASEESVAASETLANQAESLKKLVEEFRY